MRRVWRLLMTDLTRGDLRRSRRHRGAALVFIIVIVAIMALMIGDHVYTSTVDMRSSWVSMDEVKAEFAARSGANLTRILFEVQARIIDPVRKSIAAFLQHDLQVKDFVGFLLPIFFGQSGMLGALGVDLSGASGLGFPKNYGTVDVLSFESEDGKINVNCANVRTETDPQVQKLSLDLYTLFKQDRYRELFENLKTIDDPDRPMFLTRAIIDYIDQDTAQFAGGGAAENYRYEGYEAKDNVIDSLEELHLVKGIDDLMWVNFAPALTVYGGCKINLCAVPQGNWLTAALVILRSARDPQHPVFQNILQLYQVSMAALSTLKMFGCADLQLFAQGAANPGALAQAGGLGIPGVGLPGAAAPTGGAGQQVPGVELDPAKLQTVAEAEARRVYRVVFEGKAGAVFDGAGQKSWRVRRRLTVVWDQKARSTVTGRMGLWHYWRYE